MRPLESERALDLDAVYTRLQSLESEVARLRAENARLRAHPGGHPTLIDVERAFMREPERGERSIPPPPTYRELPAVPPVSGRLDAQRGAPLGGVDVGYVNRVSEDQLDQLPYGLVVLDRDGRVLLYNETESRLTGFARSRVIGRNFFREVAPCTAVKEFEGVFREFVAGRHGRTTFFDFAFHFSAGTQNVTIALAPGRRPGQINVMMMRR